MIKGKPFPRADIDGIITMINTIKELAALTHSDNKFGYHDPNLQQTLVRT